MKQQTDFLGFALKAGWFMIWTPEERAVNSATKAQGLRLAMPCPAQKPWVTDPLLRVSVYGL